jgi:hypothetical protein
MANTKIEISGIKYYLGLGFLNELIESTGKKLNEIGQEDEVTLLPKLMYYARLYADKREGRTPNYTLDDIFDYIDENGGRFGEVSIAFHKAYIEAMTEGVPVDDKKKATVIRR